MDKAIVAVESDAEAVVTYRDSHQATLLQIEALKAENRELKRRLGEEVEESMVSVVVDSISLPETFEEKLAERKRVVQASRLQEEKKKKKRNQLIKEEDRQKKERHKRLRSIFKKILKKFRKKVDELGIEEALEKNNRITLYQYNYERLHFSLCRDGFFDGKSELVNYWPDDREKKWSVFIDELVDFNVDPEKFKQSIEESLVKHFEDKKEEQND